MRRIATARDHEPKGARVVRAFPVPRRWSVVSGALACAPGTLSEATLRSAFGNIWNGRQWYAVARTDETLTVEADDYYAWCRTNRWLAQSDATWPAVVRDWLTQYVWTDPPQVPDAVARIALTTGGWIRDRQSRYLAVQAPGRPDWTGSAGGGITPDDGWGPAVPEQAWRREAQEELGIRLERVRPLGVVADPRTDCWCWLFEGVWAGDWDNRPWQGAADGALEVRRVAVLDADAAPPSLSPVAAWAWAAVRQGR